MVLSTTKGSSFFELSYHLRLFPVSFLISRSAKKMAENVGNMGLSREKGAQPHAHLAAPKWPKTIGNLAFYDHWHLCHPVVLSLIVLFQIAIETLPWGSNRNILLKIPNQ